MTTYQVAYKGQILTKPLDREVALAIAIEENIDAYQKGHFPLCEIVLAFTATCAQCDHFDSSMVFEDYDGACLKYFDHARSDDLISAKCKAFRPVTQ